MRIASCVPTVLATLGLLTGVAGAEKRASLLAGSAPAVERSEPVHRVSALQLVNDGSFEQGPPPGSAWTEFTTTICEWIVDPFSVFGVSAFDGSFVYWAGGYCPLGNPSTDSVTQTLAVPTGTTELSFWYLLDRGDPDDEGLDMAYIAVDADTIWTIPLSQANSTALTYVNVTLPFSTYAGQSVDLQFGGFGVGLTGNLLFDFIEFNVETIAVVKSKWAEVKSRYRLMR